MPKLKEVVVDPNGDTVGFAFDANALLITVFGVPLFCENVAFLFAIALLVVDACWEFVKLSNALVLCEAFPAEPNANGSGLEACEVLLLFPNENKGAADVLAGVIVEKLEEPALAMLLKGIALVIGLALALALALALKLLLTGAIPLYCPVFSMTDVMVGVTAFTFAEQTVTFPPPKVPRLELEETFPAGSNGIGELFLLTSLFASIRPEVIKPGEIFAIEPVTFPKRSVFVEVVS